MQTATRRIDARTAASACAGALAVASRVERDRLAPDHHGVERPATHERREMRDELHVAVPGDGRAARARVTGRPLRRI